MAQQKMYVAADPLGAELKDAVVQHLQKAHPDLQVQDLGTYDKYYEAAHKVGSLVQQSQAAGVPDKAVLCCGTGMGMSIIANKYPDVYAAVVESATAAANAAAINKANVLTLGGKLFEADEAASAVDKWLSTPFTEGYPEFKDFLEASMSEIPTMVKGQPHSSNDAAGNKGSNNSTPYPSVAIEVNGQLPHSWQPIGPMNHSSCVWCKLREDFKSGGYASAGTRLRALARFPKGSLEPAHHHSHGHDVLVLVGDKTVHNKTTGETVRLGPWGYLYTPAGQVHSVEYHQDTVYFIGFDGPMDLIWDKEGASGVEWVNEEAQKAAGKPWKPSDAVLAAARAAAEAPQ